MQASLTTPSAPSVQMPLMLVAEVQDSLLVVVHDLNRLDGLLAHTMENLMERFTAASANLANPDLIASKELDVVRSTLRAAVTELQFQDMASQLITHTSKILQAAPTAWPPSPWAARTARPCPLSKRCRSGPTR